MTNVITCEKVYRMVGAFTATKQTVKNPSSVDNLLCSHAKQYYIKMHFHYIKRPFHNEVQKIRVFFIKIKQEAHGKEA